MIKAENNGYGDSGVNSKSSGSGTPSGTSSLSAGLVKTLERRIKDLQTEKQDLEKTKDNEMQIQNRVIRSLEKEKRDLERNVSRLERELEQEKKQSDKKLEILRKKIDSSSSSKRNTVTSSSISPTARNSRSPGPGNSNDVDNMVSDATHAALKREYEIIVLKMQSQERNFLSAQELLKKEVDDLNCQLLARDVEVETLQERVEELLKRIKEL